MMPPTKPVGEKPPDPNGGGGRTGAQEAPPAHNQEDHRHGGPHRDEGAPAAVTATASTGKKQGFSYANKLRTNIRFDQRLKRNVLEIHIEKSDKFAQVDLGGDTMVRVL